MTDSTPKDLEHDTLLKLVKSFAPAITTKGVCEGFTGMWLQAVLTGKKEEEEFYARLDVLSKHKHIRNKQVELLKKEIDQVYETRASTKSKEPLSESNRMLTDIRAFAESIAIQLDPQALEVFDHYVPQTTKSKYDLTRSDALEQENKKIDSNVIGVVSANKKELVDYFSSLSTKISEAAGTEKTSFLLSSADHTVGVYFDPLQQGDKKWCFLDINHLSGKRKYYSQLNSSSLAEHLFNSFGDDKKSETSFSVRCLSTQTNPELLKAMKETTTKLLAPPLTQTAPAVFGRIGEVFSNTKKSNVRASNALILAAGLGQNEIVNDLIHKSSADVNTVDKKGFTALILAAQDGYLNVVETLIKQGANVSAVDKEGNTALIRAVHNGHTEIVKALIMKDKGLVNKANKKGGSALLMAVKNDHRDIIDILIKESANVIGVGKKPDFTAVTLAASYGHSDILHMLMGAMPSKHIETASNEIEQVFNLAIQNNQFKIIKGLISLPYINQEAGLEKLNKNLNLAFDKNEFEVIKGIMTIPGINRNSALEQLNKKIILAIKDNNFDMLKSLIAIEGVDKDAALILASEKGQLESVRILIQAKADPNVRGEFENTALILAAQEGHASVVNELLSANLDHNAKNKYDENALKVAASADRSEDHDNVIISLINAGATLTENMDSEELGLILVLAASVGNIEMVNNVLEHEVKANPNVLDENGFSALMLAAEQGNFQIVEALIKAEAPLNLQDPSDGYTALMLAAEEGHLDIVTTLIAAKADLNITDSSNATALALATEAGHLDIVKALKAAATAQKLPSTLSDLSEPKPLVIKFSQSPSQSQKALLPIEKKKNDVPLLKFSSQKNLSPKNQSTANNKGNDPLPSPKSKK